MMQVCQRLQWRRPSGALKVRECRDLLLTMERDDRLQLPPKRAAGRPQGARTRVPCTRAGEPGPPLLGTVGQFGAVRLQAVATRADHGWWRELIGRYHYLGYRVPFGAQLRYLAFVSQPTPAVVAALQVSSPAWRLATRDRWIGWDEPTRLRHLQRVAAAGHLDRAAASEPRELCTTLASVEPSPVSDLACWRRLQSGWRRDRRRSDTTNPSRREHGREPRPQPFRSHIRGRCVPSSRS